jgi:hypothetical protein
VQLVRVDRDHPGVLSPLEGQQFDAVVDVARRPSHVRSALVELGDRVGHWTFVSTCSVYADHGTPGQRAESAPLLAAAPPRVEDADGEQYGPTGLTGTYDGIGAPVPRSQFLAAVAEGVGVTARLTWVDQDFLAAHGVQPWMGERSLPMWLPLPDYAGFMTRDVSPALRTGLLTRPLSDTARDTLGWIRTRTDRLVRELSPR